MCLTDHKICPIFNNHRKHTKMSIKKTFIAILLSLFCISEKYSQTTYTYTGKPRFQILTKRNNTTLGIINVELFPNIAPKHTRNFDSLVSTQFYDTTAFHRVIPGFMIQGGGPNSRHGAISTWGQSQPGQPTVNAEFSKAKHLRGILSAARSSNINSATSQFFICHAAALHLDNNYSIYGRVTSGINYVDTIANAPRDANDNPLVKIEMFVTYIGSNDTIPNPPALTSPTNGITGVDTLFQVQLKWLAQPDGIIYNVQYSQDSTFTTPPTFTANTGNLYHVIPSGLPSNTKYFWRIRTNNGGHYSAFSPVWSFKTAEPFSDVSIKKNVSKESLAILYPNPSNGKFNLKQVEKGSAIEVVDLAGKLIFQTIAKDSSVMIDLSGREVGVYDLSIKKGDNTINKKLVLTK
jgi:peptidyl-prolyl cis-trans isomerase B (cyclophilin B)